MTYKSTTRQHYRNQKYDANRRGIEWQFTYDTWLEWWGEDIVNRGKGKGKLCMARFNDTGPYHPANVKKLTHEQNSSEKVMSEYSRQVARTTHTGKIISEETRAKMTAANRANAMKRWHNLA